MPSSSALLTPKALLIAAVAGIATAIACAALMPSSGAAGVPTTSTQPTEPPVECNGETATVVMLNPGEYIGDDSDQVIVGTSGEDTIRGRGGNDIICGLGADDFISGGKADDELDGGEGDDLLRGRQEDDELDGGSEAAKRGIEDDVCMGGRPEPDIKGGADVAFNCEQVIGAITPF